MDPQVAWENLDHQDSLVLLDQRERLALMDLRALSDPKDLVEIMVYPVLLVKLELLDLVDLTDPLERKVHVVTQD